jgi:propanol-preferring alcohol dehydrogenase
VKAAIFYGPAGSWPEKPMGIEEVPEPTIGPDEVLVKVAACGLCRTDLEYLKHGIKPPKAPPLILGHEPSGTVVEVGDKVEQFKKNDRVVVAYLAPCGACSYCREGKENICQSAETIGAGRDGAFAEFLGVPAKNLCLLPDEVSLQEASIIADAVASPFHGLVNIAAVKTGDVIAIYGASGGLGLCSVQIAKALGAYVIGIGRQPWKLDKAKEVGADEVISTTTVENIADEVNRISNGGVDISFDVSGAPAMIEAGIKSTKPTGKIVLLAFNFQKVQFNIGRLMWLEHAILGSRNYRPLDMPRMVELVRDGKINLDKVVSHRFPLEEINAAYELLDQGNMLRGIIAF